MVSPKHGGTFISTPIMKASFVEALLEMFGSQSHRSINPGLSHFLVTQKLHAQGLSHNRRQPEKRIIFFLKPLKTCGAIYSERWCLLCPINVPQGQHPISGAQFSYVSPASEWAWGGGQHDSIATTTLMRGRETFSIKTAGHWVS